MRCADALPLVLLLLLLLGDGRPTGRSWRSCSLREGGRAVVRGCVAGWHPVIFWQGVLWFVRLLSVTLCFSNKKEVRHAAGSSAAARQADHQAMRT